MAPSFSDAARVGNNRENSPSQPKQAVLIVGMHRSGTSALTGVLHRLGCAMPSGLMQPGADNPTGFWESAELADIHDAALVSAGVRWDTPIPIAPDWFESNQAAGFHTQIRAAIERDFANCSLFAIKDPRMCLLFPLWESVLQHLNCSIKVLLPIRHPEATIESLVTRNHMSASRAQLLWLSYVLVAEQATRHIPRAFVHYDDLLSDWRTALAKIEADLGWHFPHRTPEIEAEIDTFLQPNLRHHQASEASRSSISLIERWIADTYDQLTRVRTHQSIEQAVMDGIHQDAIAAAQAFGTLTAEAEASVNRLQLQVESLQHRLRATQNSLQEVAAQKQTLQRQVSECQEQLRGGEFQKAELTMNYQKLLRGLRNIQASRTWRITMPFRWVTSKGKSLVSRLRGENEQRAALLSSPLFDENYYRQMYADELEATGLAPLDHFLQLGVEHRCNPHPLFDIEYYCAQNKDVEASGVNPLWHFLVYGGQEGRKPHPLFDSRYYLYQNLSLLVSETNPLEHYLREGAAEGLDPSEYFETGFYLSHTTDPEAPHNPLLHYLKTGARAGMATSRSDVHPLEWKVWPALEQATLRDSLAREAAALRFPECDNPDISIIIPVYNKIDYTLQCLKALMKQTSGMSCEVILADDCSSDATQELLSTVPGLQYRRNPENLGFLRSCNRAAELAKGKILVLLNNDTVPLEHWLAELIAPLQQENQVGLVGSMLLYPNGCLQEAGGAIWQDGSGWNIGRLQDPQGCDYQFVREVDYCSGASFAVPIALWHQLNGFDLRYAPAYYEDTDFAFRVREAGFKTIYTPFSQLIHFEGISSGTDTSSGVKRYQAVNQSVFAERWQSRLQGRCAPETPELATYASGDRPQLLWLDALTPTPDRDSGSIDTLNFLTVARDMGWEVSFIPTSNLLRHARYTEDLQRLGVRCLYWPYIDSAESYLATYGHLFDAVVLSRVSVAKSLLPTVKRYAPQAAVAFNTVDLHFLRQQRQQEVTGDGNTVNVEATRADELNAIDRCDLTIAISSVEAATIRELMPSAIVKTVPIARTIPGRTAPFEQRRDICFLGGFNHDPNVDAVLYFVEDIWPLVAKQLPDCNFIITGSDMPDRIRQLESDRIQTLGYVEELSNLFERVRLSVAPLRFGAGLKGKVISSFSYGVPAVCTPIAVEGMSLPNGYIERWVADCPEAFANGITQAYSNSDLWLEASNQALDCAQENFSLDAVTPTIQAVLTELQQLRSANLATSDNS